jgi:hypothetical protein
MLIKNYFSLLLFLFIAQSAIARYDGIIIDSTQLYINANDEAYKNVKAGDTLFFQAGAKDYLLLVDFQGEPGKPIVMINYQGTVDIDTDHYFGVAIHNCRYIKFTGTGDTNEFYGFQITRVSAGAGMGIGQLSSDFEIDHISIKDVLIGGIYAKTDPDCSGNTTREFFTQYNTLIHDNYIENTGNEGMYIGSTKYNGQTVSCNGKDTLLLPSVLEGVKVYNNIVKNAGWDGIQVSSAVKDCEVFQNQIFSDSQAEYPNQMSGIILGGGSKANCYNNYIADGKGDGIENHGLGGNKIYNNIIVNPGRSYYPDDLSAFKMKHGIFLTDVSSIQDSSITIVNNTIINPKSDGIRFSSVKTRNNLIAANVIINPGNFDLYENDNTRFEGEDAYVEIPYDSTDVILKNNYFEQDLSELEFNEDYSLVNTSSLIDAGYSGGFTPEFDYNLDPRPIGEFVDIGAFECQNPVETLKDTTNEEFSLIYPNPVKTILTIQITVDILEDYTFEIYNSQGQIFAKKDVEIVSIGENQTSIDVSNWPNGLYFCVVKSENKTQTHKFLHY